MEQFSNGSGTCCSDIGCICLVAMVSGHKMVHNDLMKLTWFCFMQSDLDASGAYGGVRFSGLLQPRKNVVLILSGSC